MVHGMKRRRTSLGFRTLTINRTRVEEAEAAWLAFMKKQRHSPGKEFEAHCTSPYEPSVRCTGKGKSPVSSSSSRSSSHGVTIEQAIEERDEAVHKFEELKSKMKLLLLD